MERTIKEIIAAIVYQQEKSIRFRRVRATHMLTITCKASQKSWHIPVHSGKLKRDMEDRLVEIFTSTKVGKRIVQSVSRSLLLSEK